MTVNVSHRFWVSIIRHAFALNVSRLQFWHVSLPHCQDYSRLDTQEYKDNTRMRQGLHSTSQQYFRTSPSLMIFCLHTSLTVRRSLWFTRYPRYPDRTDKKIGFWCDKGSFAFSAPNGTWRSSVRGWRECTQALRGLLRIRSEIVGVHCCQGTVLVYAIGKWDRICP